MPVVEAELALHPRQLAVARALVERAARENGLSETERFELVFAVNEAVTNAVRYGPQEEQATVGLRIDAEPGGLAVTVRSGGNFTPPAGTPDPWAEGGRGFHYMRLLMDEVRVDCTGTATAVRLFKARRTACACG